MRGRSSGDWTTGAWLLVGACALLAGCAQEATTSGPVFSGSPLESLGGSAAPSCNGISCSADETITTLSFHKEDDHELTGRIQASATKAWVLYLTYDEGSVQKVSYARFPRTVGETRFEVFSDGNGNTEGMVETATFCGISDGASIVPRGLILALQAQGAKDVEVLLQMEVHVPRWLSDGTLVYDPPPRVTWRGTPSECEWYEKTPRRRSALYALCYVPGESEENYWCNGGEDEELTHALYWTDDEAAKRFIDTAYENAARTGDSSDESVGIARLTTELCTEDGCEQSGELTFSPLSLMPEGGDAPWWYIDVHDFASVLSESFVRSAMASDGVELTSGTLVLERIDESVEVAFQGTSPSARLPED